MNKSMKFFAALLMITCLPFLLASANKDEISYPCFCPLDSNGSECGGKDICLNNKGSFINEPPPNNNPPRGPARLTEINFDTLREALKAEGLTESEIQRIEIKIKTLKNETQKPNE